MYRALLMAATAAGSWSYYHYQKRKARLKCKICALQLFLHSQCQLGCGHIFHESCLRIYVRSLINCTVKCPECPKKIRDAEIRRLESWAPTDKLFCHFCSKLVDCSIVQGLPCMHKFCQDCLSNYIEAMESINEPSKCPLSECGTLIPDYVANLVHGV